LSYGFRSNRDQSAAADAEAGTTIPGQLMILPQVRVRRARWRYDVYRAYTLAARYQSTCRSDDFQHVLSSTTPNTLKASSSKFWGLLGQSIRCHHSRAFSKA
jgi:hypothetical protein